MPATNRIKAKAILFASPLCGGVSMLLFVIFLFSGPLGLVKMELKDSPALLWDGMLSIIFFSQHSGMIRRGFRTGLSKIIPTHYIEATFAIASSIVLAVVVILWQPTTTIVYELEGPPRWIVRGLFFLAIVGMAWGVSALKAFDPFGRSAIRANMSGNPPRSQEFNVYGPYLWVRHPLYFFVLILIWTCPDMTTDRLLFNILWSVWIYVGAVLEEKDLLTEFGQAYQVYRQKVPMLIPWKRPSYP